MYLDANFFVFMNALAEKQGKRARRILAEIMSGRRAVTSSLALDEVMWVIRKAGRNNELREVVEEIYAIPNLEVKEASPLVPLKAVRIIEEYNLKPRDAIHLAVMKEYGVSEIVTDDADFDKVDGITRVKL